MSSSVFFESSSKAKSGDGRNGEVSADLDLVVVYGRNGVNFDPSSVETLIEEKALSSISVVRITSPTPSMVNEEEEAERLEQLLRRQNTDSDNEYSDDSIKKTSDVDKLDAESDYKNLSDCEEKTCDEREKSTLENNTKRKKSLRTNNKTVSNKIQISKQKPKENERPEIVGLVLEKFFPTQIATEMGKEALKTAGIPSFKRSADSDLQLFVIKNDHCYTPFTSPSQMKQKLESERAEAEKHHTAQRKLFGISTLKHKGSQFHMERKIIHNKNVKSKEDQQNENSVETNEESEEAYTSDEEQEVESLSIESVDSDNDRASDLDFDVNNRKGRRRRIPLIKKIKRHNLQKSIIKRLQSQEKDNSNNSQKPLLSQRTKITKNLYPGDIRIGKVPLIITKPTNTVTKSSTGITQSHVSNKPTENIISTTTHKTIAAVARKGPILQVGASTLSRTFSSQSPHAVKEIVINKVMASPKGGFTDISALLTQSDKVTGNVSNTLASNLRNQNQTPSTKSKGFMPLVIETAARNQLPAQISIQTHQSSSELAAEHDKQLDLIDSIVQHEMQKPIAMQEVQSACNENIPELVKMLESTEKALESNIPQQLNSFNANSIVGNIDITTTPLLNSPVDDIPEDLLQDVVKLIEDDKTLKEAVDKQVLAQSNNNCDIVSTTSSAPPPLAPIFQKTAKQTSNLPQEIRTTDIIENKTLNVQPKSIIEMTITNNTIMRQPEVASLSNTEDDAQSTKTFIVRKEPIKIIRGNGRIITLPPIEAPTTRAKLRAQYQPNEQSSNMSPTSTTLNDSAVDVTLQSNSSQKSIDNSVTEKKFITIIEKRRSSKDARKTTARKSTSNKSHGNSNKKETEDDDDPKKLWCVCRQPHNNRFMICCDVCEDWFHGTCVNITKTMGLEMEQKGVDWTCPKCAENKKQLKIKDMLVTKTQKSDSHNEEVKTTVNKVVIAVNQQNTPIFITKTDNTQIKKQPIDPKKNETVTSHLKGPTTSTPKRIIVVKRVSAPKVTTVNKSLHPQQHQPKIHNYVVSKPPNSNLSELPLCIVCRKNKAQMGKIYCSDDCINKHAKAAGSNVTEMQLKSQVDDKKKKMKELFEDQLAMIDRKVKIERINVIERKSGRILTGNNAPTAMNLKKWIQENPTFEVLQPGSIEAIEHEKKHKTHDTLESSHTNTSKNQNTSPTTHENIIIVSPTNFQPSKEYKEESEISTSTSRTKKFVENVKTETRTSHQTTNKLSQRRSSQVGIKTDKVMRPDSKEDKSIEKISKRRNSESSYKVILDDPEPVRENVRRTLKEQLLIRLSENKKDSTTDNSNLSTEEVDKFVTETESEMFECFNHEINSKYKSKYRTLMFNIKDRKNLTLFSKIYEKQIEPKQLVRMTPEELASQELTQWRQKEAQHQLDIIKKNELYRLQCSKNYVLKTHKGEEVIEGSKLDCVNIDISVPVEDVVSILNNSKDGVINEPSDEIGSNNSNQKFESILSHNISLENVDDTKVLYKDKDKLRDHDNNTNTFERKHVSESDVEKSDDSKKMNKQKDKGRVRSRDHEHSNEYKHSHDKTTERDKRHKSRDRHKDKSHSRKRSRSHSRSRSRSREKRHKSSHKYDRRDKDERHREKDREVAKCRDRKEDEKKLVDKKSTTTSSSTGTTIIKSSHNKAEKKSSAKKSVLSKPLNEFNLVDKIIESSKTIEEAANLVSGKDKDLVGYNTSGSNKLHATEVQAKSKNINENVVDIEIDDETTSTTSNTHPHNPYMTYNSYSFNKTANSPIIWSGNINMIDVASFQIIIQSVMGTPFNLAKLLPKELDIVGRIEPETVWDYISKIKKSPNKEIIILRLLPTCESETSAYTILYQYLENRHRLGVIKTASVQIKDFYVIPLECGNKLPEVLLPMEHTDFFEDPNRPDMLVGLIVRVIGRRSTTAAVEHSTTLKMPRLHNKESFTPPGSPKHKIRHHSSLSKPNEFDIDAIIKAPMVPATNIQNYSKDDDEPYSPVDDEPNVPIEESKDLSITFSRRMEELNRQIAAQQIEIDGLLTEKSTRYTTSAPATSTQLLANISIPSNLPQILASIKSKPDMNSRQNLIAPPPPSYNVMNQYNCVNGDEEYDPAEAIQSTYQTSNFYPEKPTSRLAQLSEAELLKLVPDDMIEETCLSLQPGGTSKPCYEEPPPPGV